MSAGEVGGGGKRAGALSRSHRAKGVGCIPTDLGCVPISGKAPPGSIPFFELNRIEHCFLEGSPMSETADLLLCHER